MSLYNIPFNISITRALQYLITNTKNNSPYLIITPNKRAKELCTNELIKINNRKITITSISETKELLNEFLPKTITSIQDKITKSLTTNVINPNVRSFILSNLIKASDKTLGLEKALTLADSIAELLDILETENVPVNDLTRFIPFSVFAENILKLLKTSSTHWKNILIELNVKNILAYKSNSLALLSETIDNITTDTNIIIFAIDNYSTSTTTLLKSIVNYKFGTLIFSGIDNYISENNWIKLNRTHPQYINSRITCKLGINRDNITDLQNLTENDSYNSIVFRIFDTFPYKIDNCILNRPQHHLNNKQLSLFNEHNNLKPNLTNLAVTKKNNVIDNLSFIEVETETDEAKVIANLIINKLSENSPEPLHLVTSNIDLTKRILFYLDTHKIEYDSSFGTELNRTSYYTFFSLITNININNINFINLLSLLKHPLCTLCKNIKHVELIDLYLARELNYDKSIKSYLNFLNTNVYLKNKISNEDYLAIKEILNKLLSIYNNYNNFNITNTETLFNFKEVLEEHIKIAEQLSFVDSNYFLIWETKLGETFKMSLSAIIEESKFIPNSSLLEYNSILSNLLSKYSIRKYLSTKTKVFVSGILQAQFIKKGTIIVADLNEESFPAAPKQEIALFNYILQKLDLPTKYDTIGKEAFIFNKLCCSENKVYLTRSSKKQNSITTPSRFITRLLNTLSNNKIRLNNKELIDIYKNINNHYNSVSTTSNDISIEANPIIKYRPKDISVTSVEKLLKNPYIFFIEQVLKLRTINPINPNLSNLYLGNIIHEILHIALTKDNGNLKSLSLSDLSNKLMSLTKQKFSSYFVNNPSSLLHFNIFSYFINDISKNLLNLILNTQTINSEVSGTLKIKFINDEINLRARADCIAINNNSACIIDFKTGSTKINKKSIEEYRKQLIIFGYMLINGCFFNKDLTITALEYWQAPNNCSDEFCITNIAKILKETNLQSYIETEFKMIKETLHDFLLTEKPFTFNIADKSLLKEYRHFSRKQD